MVTPAWLTGAVRAAAAPATSVTPHARSLSIVFFTAASIFNSGDYMGLRLDRSAIIRAERRMRLLQSLTGVLLVIAAVCVDGQTGFPKDVCPEPGNRFPAVRTGLTPDAFGPGPIRQYSPGV